MMLAIATILLSVLTAAPADLTGRWEGKLTATRPDGTAHEDTALLLLKQTGSTITGTIGGSDTDQHPIVSGSVDGDKVVISAKHASNDREFKLELKLLKDELSGTMVSGDRRAELQLKRRKE